MRQPLVKTLLVIGTLVAFAGSLGFALAGCGSEERGSPGAPSQQTSTASGPAPWPSEGSSPARLSGDGRYFGYIRAASADPPAISFDVAQFFYGKSVQEAAEKNGAVKPGEPVSNDHYELNRVKEIRVLQLAPDVQVSAGPPASFLMGHLELSPEVRKKCAVDASPGSCTMSRAAFFAAAKELDERYGIPVWVTIREGLVVRIDEQYFP